MTALLYPLLPLFLSVAIMLAGSGLMGTLLAVRMDAEQFSTGLIGTVMGSYSVGFVLASLVFQKVIFRVGHIRAFTCLAALAAGSVLLYPLIVSPIAWALLRGVFGFCVAGLYMIAESWLNDRAPSGQRGRVLALYSITVCAASGGGQLFINLWDISGYELFSLAAVLLAVAIVPISLARTASPVLVEAKPVTLRRLYQISPLAFVGAAAGGLMSGAFMALGPVFGRQVGLSLVEVSIFMAAALLGGLLLQWPLGRLSDTLGRRPAIVGVGLITAAIGVAVVLLGGVSELGLVALVLVWGGLAFALYPLCLALSNDFIRSDELVGTGAGLLLVNGGGMILGPVVVSWLMQWGGPQMLFLSTAVVAVALAGFGIWRHRVGVALPLSAQGDYVVMAQTTALAGALDPRAEDWQLELPFDLPLSVASDAAEEESGRHQGHPYAPALA